MTLPLFVVGTGRCGSTLLSNMLNLHDDILSLSEFFAVLGGEMALTGEEIDGRTLWTRLQTIGPVFSQLIRMHVPVPELLYEPEKIEASMRSGSFSPLLLVPLPHISNEPESLLDEIRLFALSRPVTRITAHYDAIFNWLCRRLGKAMWVERSGGSVAYLDRILQGWPTARLIHIFRDGRACAYSMSRHPVFQAVLLREAGTAEGSPDQPDIRRFGLAWSSEVVKAASVFERLPSAQVLHIQYECLVAQPRQELTRLWQFLTYELPSDTWLDSAAGLVRRTEPSWVGLNEADRQALNRACRPGMQKLATLARMVLA